jgi:pyruvate formate lyase activating enzyme
VPVKIAHLERLSSIDYPGRLAAVVWTVGCNLRCPFCYNPELVLPHLSAQLSPLPSREVLEVLRERRGFLDGLCVTGGEPTLQPQLPEFLARVKGLGLAVKLDTNGTQPQALELLLQEKLVDYVALDVKAPRSRYPEFTGISQDVSPLVQESLEIVRRMAPDYEVRTTVAPGLGPEDLEAIAREVAGAKRYVLQPFFVPQGKGLVDESWRGRPHLSPAELTPVAERLAALLPCRART